MLGTRVGARLSSSSLAPPCPRGASAPLFSESATAREVNAIDSEHAKNLQSDFWRYEQLLKLRVHWPVAWDAGLPSWVSLRGCPADIEQELRAPRTSLLVDFIDNVDYSVWDPEWVDSLRSEFHLS